MRHILSALILATSLFAAPVFAQRHPVYYPPDARELAQLHDAEKPATRAGDGSTAATPVSDDEAGQLAATGADQQDLRDLRGGHHPHAELWWDDWIFWLLIPAVVTSIIITVLLFAIIF